MRGESFLKDLNTNSHYVLDHMVWSCDDMSSILKGELSNNVIIT